MRLILTLLIVLASVSTQAKVERCVDGIWRFDKSNSDNLQKITRKLLKRVPEGSTLESNGMPQFVFSAADLKLSKTADAVQITLQDELSLSRQFSTIGKTQAVSLKQLHTGNHTVVASWDEQALIVETTTPQGLYIEETFTLETEEGVGQRLRIDSRVRNRVGMALFFTKSYLHAERDWQLCVAKRSIDGDKNSQLDAKDSTAALR